MFQFPTNGKGHLKKTKKEYIMRFNIAAFQFPTNGKGHLKTEGERNVIVIHPVSIPYEREGSSKAR